MTLRRSGKGVTWASRLSAPRMRRFAGASWRGGVCAGPPRRTLCVRCAPVAPPMGLRAAAVCRPRCGGRHCGPRDGLRRRRCGVVGLGPGALPEGGIALPSLGARAWASNVIGGRPVLPRRRATATLLSAAPASQRKARLTFPDDANFPCRTVPQCGMLRPYGGRRNTPECGVPRRVRSAWREAYVWGACGPGCHGIFRPVPGGAACPPPGCGGCRPTPGPPTRGSRMRMPSARPRRPSPKPKWWPAPARACIARAPRRGGRRDGALRRWRCVG